MVLHDEDQVFKEGGNSQLLNAALLRRLGKRF